MLVFGRNVLEEIINTGKDIRKIYISKNLKDANIFTMLKTNNIHYLLVDSFKLDKMVDGNHQGIVVEINDYKYSSLEEVINKQENLIVILDHLEDPHNLGAIIRTCEAFGVSSIIIPKDRSVSVNGTVMKISSGALTRVNVCEVNNLVQAINKLKDNGYFVYGASMNGTDYQKVSYADKKVLVIGNEGKGLSKLVNDACDEIIKITMTGQINSLNASVAAGILINGIK